MIKKSLLWSVVLCMLAALCLTGCQAATTTAPPATSAPAGTTTPSGQATATPSNLPPLKVGLITSLTGANAFQGSEVKQGALIGQEFFGEVNGRKFELVIADGPDVTAVQSEFERLCNEGIKTFVYGTNSDRAIAKLVDSRDVFYLSVQWDDTVNEDHAKNFIQAASSLKAFSSGIYDKAIEYGQKYLNKSKDELKIGVIYNAVVKFIADPCLNAFKANNKALAIEENYPYDTKDYVPLVTRLKNANLDILIPFQLSQDGAPFRKKMVELAYTPPLVLAGGMYYDQPDFQATGGEMTDGIVTQSFVTPFIKDSAAKGLKEFVAEYNKKYGHDPLTHALQAYTIVQLLSKLLETIPVEDWDKTDKLVAGIKALKIDYGELAWHNGFELDENNMNKRYTKFITGQWQDNKLVPCSPDELKMGDLKIPYKK